MDKQKEYMWHFIFSIGYLAVLSAWVIYLEKNFFLSAIVVTGYVVMSQTISKLYGGLKK